MKETQKTIVKWCDDTFGPAPSVMRIACRANEEMAELLRGIAAQQDHVNLVEEAADIVIALYRMADVMGCDLDLAIDCKMAINRGREWNIDGTGHGYHKGVSS